MQGKQTHDFRRYLQDELERRAQLNPSYSIRAFARQLDTDSSFLSKILTGKRAVTSKTILKFGSKLGLGPTEYKKFIPSRSVRSSKATTQFFHDLHEEEFRIIADWHHYAILELVQVGDFQPSVAWIAKALGITHAESLAAIDRLKRMGMLEITPSGEWKNISGNNTTTGNPYTSEAFRSLQRQILAQAMDAMDAIPMDERDQSSITLCVDASRLPEAKERIRVFRRELMRFLESGPKKDKVYQLSVSLFPVSHRNMPQPRSRKL